MIKQQQFYTYMWLRKDGTPYCAGKGSGPRLFRNRGRPCQIPDDRSRIVVFPMDSEVLAFESEKALIDLFGRKDNGTGILRNRTDGGEGTSGYRVTMEAKENLRRHRLGTKASAKTREKMSKQRKGKKTTFAPLPRFGEENSMFGKHHSTETRNRMSESQKKAWNKSKARRAAQSELMRLLNARRWSREEL